MIETVALEDDELLRDLAWDCDQTRQASRESGSARHGLVAVDSTLVRLFDLVLTCDLAVHHTNLLSAESLEHTATVLSVLQPGGEFVIVNRHVATGISQETPGHGGRCFVHHFAGYPGACRVAEFGGSTFGRVAWPWRWGRAAEVSYQIVTHRVPQRTIPLGQWLRYGQAEAERHDEVCCDSGALGMRQPATSAFAA